MKQDKKNTLKRKEWRLNKIKNRDIIYNNWFQVDEESYKGYPERLETAKKACKIFNDWYNSDLIEKKP